MNEPTIVHGPIIPFQARTVYSVTLLSGHVVTSPEGFGSWEALAPVADEPKPDYVYRPRDHSPQPESTGENSD